MSDRESEPPPRRDAVLVVDKPEGPTSHDIVAQARRHFGERRIGHAGTLDPMATGVLVLLFGEATKLSSLVTGHDKTYVADLGFGRGTDTHDARGETTEASAGEVGQARLEAALQVERERTLQRPPDVSAVKVSGQRAYRLARKGASPELEARPVRVRSLSILERDGPRVRLRLSVSAGYYVRALARDVGAAVGVPAHLTALRRLRSGPFAIERASPWPAPTSATPAPLDQVLPELVPTVRLSPAGVIRAAHGKLLSRDDFVDDPEEALERWYASRDPSSQDVPAAPIWGWTDAEGRPIAVGVRSEPGYRVRRGFRLQADDRQVGYA